MPELKPRLLVFRAKLVATDMPPAPAPVAPDPWLEPPAPALLLMITPLTVGWEEMVPSEMVPWLTLMFVEEREAVLLVRPVLVALEPELDEVLAVLSVALLVVREVVAALDDRVWAELDSAVALRVAAAERLSTAVALERATFSLAGEVAMAAAGTEAGVLPRGWAGEAAGPLAVARGLVKSLVGTGFLALISCWMACCSWGVGGRGPRGAVRRPRRSGCCPPP